MNLLLDSTAISWALFALAAGIIGFIYLIRFQLAKRSQQEQFEKADTTISSRNKHTEVIDNDVPRTIDPPKPPPPPPPPPVIEEVDLDELEEEPEFVDAAIEEDEEVIAPPPPAPVAKVPEKPTLLPPPVVVDNTPIMFAEQMPRFPGCVVGDKKAKDACSTKGLLTFLSSKLNYPALARENGIAGTAVIRFVVEKDGSLTNLEIVKDPGGGLGKEALRVVNLMNNMDQKWTPGKQNARPVRVRFNLPVKFRLQ